MNTKTPKGLRIKLATCAVLAIAALSSPRPVWAGCHFWSFADGNIDSDKDISGEPNGRPLVRFYLVCHDSLTDIARLNPDLGGDAQSIAENVPLMVAAVAGRERRVDPFEQHTARPRRPCLARSRTAERSHDRLGPLRHPEHLAHGADVPQDVGETRGLQVGDARGTRERGNAPVVDRTHLAEPLLEDVGDEVLEPRAEAPEVFRTLTIDRSRLDLEEGPAVGQRASISSWVSRVQPASSGCAWPCAAGCTWRRPRLGDGHGRRALHGALRGGAGGGVVGQLAMVSDLDPDD